MKYSLKGIFCGLMLTASLVHAHGNSHGSIIVAQASFDPDQAPQMMFGKAGDPKKASRTIHVIMDDKMRFTPREIKVQQGETIKFVVSNKGRIMHEMVLGTRKELLQHAEMMRKFPGMEHDEPYMAHVRPGKSEILVWHFNQAGELEFGCLLPGHFEAGMVGKIRVVAGRSQATR